MEDNNYNHDDNQNGSFEMVFEDEEDRSDEPGSNQYQDGIIREAYIGDEEQKEDCDSQEDDFPMDDVMKTSTKHTPEDFKHIHVIGKGSYGKVYLVRKIVHTEDSNQLSVQPSDDTTGELYAMKVLKKEDLRARKQVEHTKSERRILEKINHPFIVGLHCAFQTPEKLYFVLDY